MAKEDDTHTGYHHDDRIISTKQEALNEEVSRKSALNEYWRANLHLLGWLLAIWFVTSFGFGIILADTLDSFTVLGFPMGFWFAQQGAIYVFVVLIFAYVFRMHQIDKKFGLDDGECKPEKTLKNKSEDMS
ncbi:MAG: DUF4212 domain-containing protein [Rhodospirillaceae bacterium]